MEAPGLFTDCQVVMRQPQVAGNQSCNSLCLAGLGYDMACGVEENYNRSRSVNFGRLRLGVWNYSTRKRETDMGLISKGSPVNNRVYVRGLLPGPI